MADGEPLSRHGPSLPLRLIGLLAVAHTGFAGSRLVLTLQAVHLHASPFLVGVIMSLLMVVPMLIAVPTGRWADRSGFRAPSLLGVGTLALAGAIGAAIPSLLALGVASVLVGSGYMLAHVALSHAIGVASPPQHRSRAFGVMAVAFSVSGLLGPLAAGFAIDHASHATAFGLLALLPIASALMMPRPRAVGASAGGPASPRPKAKVMDLLRHRELRAVFVVSGIISMGWDLFTFLVPLFGVRIGLSASAIGLVVGVFGAGSLAARMAIPALMRSFDEWTVLRATLGLTALCYLAFPFCTALAGLLPLAFVTGMVLGCGQPLGMSLVHSTAPPERSGEAVGVRSTITSISQTVLPLLFGALGTALGMLPVFWAAAMVLATGSAYAGRRR